MGISPALYVLFTSEALYVLVIARPVLATKQLKMSLVLSRLHFCRIDRKIFFLNVGPGWQIWFELSVVSCAKYGFWKATSGG